MSVPSVRRYGAVSVAASVILGWLPSYAGIAVAAPGTNLPAVVRDTTWLLRAERSTGAATSVFRFGPGTVPVFGDWDGDGSKTPGWFDDGVWYLRLTNDSGPPDRVLRFGRPGDLPIVGDWDTDPNFVDDVGVVRQRDGGMRWFLEADYDAQGRTSSDGRANLLFSFGRTGDAPITGRWEQVPCAEGPCPPRHHVGVVRAVGGVVTWFLESDFGPPGDHTPVSDGRANITLRYGRPGDVPVVGDWNTDSLDDVGVVRGNAWLLEGQSQTTEGGRRTASDRRHAVAFQYGSSGDHFRVWKQPFVKGPPPA